MNVTIDLPKTLYDTLAQVAQAASEPLENVVLRTMRNGMPPSLTKVPDVFHEELLNLNKLDDKELWRVIQRELEGEKVKSPTHFVADFPTLRRAYAFSLLKWRGHPMPTPYEMLVD